jgi:hypothetical protein
VLAPAVDHAGAVTYERLWERLLERLDTWANARELGPGRIAIDWLHPDGNGRTTELVMTRDEWDDVVTVLYGDFDQAAEHVRRSVMGVPADQRYLVYQTYDLIPSDSPVLPPNPDEMRLHELARQFPEGVGHWVVLDDEGNVVGELGPPSSD